MSMLLIESLSLENFSKIPNLNRINLIECKTLNHTVEMIATEYDFEQHSYFLWMQSPHTDRATFMRSQLPFQSAVESFSQPLAAVLSKISTLEMRMGLMANLSEEHGNGNPLRSHKATFRQYLKSLGATDNDLIIAENITVLAFNQSILNYCSTQSASSGAALLGIIEYLYVTVSSNISKTILDRHWVIPGSQSHYSTHETLDVSHSQDLLQLAQSDWDNSRSRSQINQSLILGAHYFWTLYQGLLPCI